eukprot:2076144-Rhodomonas_salina.1
MVRWDPTPGASGFEPESTFLDIIHVDVCMIKIDAIRHAYTRARGDLSFRLDGITEEGPVKAGKAAKSKRLSSCETLFLSQCLGRSCGRGVEVFSGDGASLLERLVDRAHCGGHWAGSGTPSGAHWHGYPGTRVGTYPVFANTGIPGRKIAFVQRH